MCRWIKFNSKNNLGITFDLLYERRKFVHNNNVSGSSILLAFRWKDLDILWVKIPIPMFQNGKIPNLLKHICYHIFVISGSRQDTAKLNYSVLLFQPEKVDPASGVRQGTEQKLHLLSHFRFICSGASATRWNILPKVLQMALNCLHLLWNIQIQNTLFTVIFLIQLMATRHEISIKN